MDSSTKKFIVWLDFFKTLLAAILNFFLGIVSIQPTKYIINIRHTGNPLKRSLKFPILLPIRNSSMARAKDTTIT